MSNEHSGDRAQKTVAELLALHGDSSGGSRRRRRREAQEQDESVPEEGPSISDTAPQSIIDRVQGEGEQRARDNTQAQSQPAWPAPHPQPQQPSGGGPAGPPNGRRAPLRPARRPAPEPNTDQFPALGAEPGELNAEPPVSPQVSASAPPAGLARWRQRRQESQAEKTDVGAVPPVPAGPDLADGDHDYYDDEDFERRRDSPDQEGFEDQEFDERDLDDGVEGDYEGYYDGDYDGDYDEDDYEAADYDDVEYGDEYEDFDEPAEAGSPGREWLTLAGQLALGVLAGAGVWLGFNWLWGKTPSAALIAALVVTLGLVWVMRKVRRAEDTQTTILALLVGLVVTVSPAALLLVTK